MSVCDRISSTDTAADLFASSQYILLRGGHILCGIAHRSLDGPTKYGQYFRQELSVRDSGSESRLERRMFAVSMIPVIRVHSPL